MKTIMFSFKQQVSDHPYLISFFALLSTLIKFVVESWSVDGFLFLLLILMVAIDTFTGVRISKQNNNFDYKVLKEKTIKKLLGYLIFMIALWIFTMMLFVMNVKDGTPVISNYYLNIPMMTTMLFFAGIEFLSIKDNVMVLYGIKTPKSINSKIENMVNAGGGDFEKLLNDN